MKHISHSLALAGMLALALSACSSMHGWGSSRSGTTGSESGTSGTSGTSGASQSGGSGYEQNASGSSGTSGSTGGGTASMGESGATAGSQGASVASISPNATVVSIDVVPRQGSSSEGDSGTASAIGSSAAGATGMSAGGDRVYRITARMDDGSTRIVTQESTPDFRAGDRVNLSNGIIAH